MKTSLERIAAWSGGVAAIAGTLAGISALGSGDRWRLSGDLVIVEGRGWPWPVVFLILLLLVGLSSYALAGFVVVGRRLRGQAQPGARAAFVVGGSLCAVGIGGAITGPNLRRFDTPPRAYACVHLLGAELESARAEAFAVGEHEFSRDALDLKVVRQLVEGREAVTVLCRSATQCGPTLSISSGVRRKLNGEAIPAGAIQRQSPLEGSCGWSVP